MVTFHFLPATFWLNSWAYLEIALMYSLLPWLLQICTQLTNFDTIPTLTDSAARLEALAASNIKFQVKEGAQTWIRDFCLIFCNARKNRLWNWLHHLESSENPLKELGTIFEKSWFSQSRQSVAMENQPIFTYLASQKAFTINENVLN